MARVRHVVEGARRKYGSTTLADPSEAQALLPVGRRMRRVQWTAERSHITAALIAVTSGSSGGHYGATCLVADFVLALVGTCSYSNSMNKIFISNK